MNKPVKTSSVLELSMTEVASAIRKGDVSSYEVTKASLDAFAAKDGSSIPRSGWSARPRSKQPRPMTSCARQGKSSARCMACRSRTRTCITRPGSSRPAVRASARISGPITPPPSSRNWKLPAPSRSAGSTWRSSRRTPPDTTSISAIATTLEPGLLHGWLLLRLGRCGGGTVRLWRAGFGYGWLDPPPRCHLRRDRHQGHADTRLTPWRDAPLLLGG